MGKTCYCLIIKIDERKVTTKKVYPWSATSSVVVSYSVSVIRSPALVGCTRSLLAKVCVQKAKEKLSEWNLYNIDFSRLIGSNVVIVVVVVVVVALLCVSRK